MPQPALPGPLPPVVSLVAELRAREQVTLPSLPSLALHGALGRSLKAVSCVEPEGRDCNECPDQATCDYAVLLEPTADAGGHFPGVGAAPPRPLVVFPDAPFLPPASGEGFDIEPGEPVRFRLSVVGEAAAARLLALEAGLEAAGQRGLGVGRRRVPFDLVLFDTLRTGRPSRPRREVALWLSTPLRLKVRGKVTSALTPQALVDGLARRAEALAAFHGEPWHEPADTEALSLGLELHARLRVLNVERQSSRQRARMVWPGLTGTALLRGPTVPTLWPLLRFASLVGLGKATTFGFGRIDLLLH